LEDVVVRENMKNKPEMFTDELFDATIALAENLEQSEPITRFRKATQLLENDHNAQELVNEATKLKQIVYAKDATREEMQKNFPRLREINNQIARNPMVQEQSQSQEMAIEFLREINQEISQLLGFDFGSMTKRQGASC
jgi:cell fate (sporulation/competence/biofilm development) regulator YlbF (YheA/YmcA/DUF963 family)